MAMGPGDYLTLFVMGAALWGAVRWARQTFFPAIALTTADEAAETAVGFEDQPAADDAPTRVPLRTWLERANGQPDKTPHLAVTGPSGSGKTTLVLAALADRAGDLVICTPKAARTDPWGGFPTVRLRIADLSYAPIAAAVADVYQEMLRRNARDDTDGAWLTLVVDDYSTVAAEVPSVRPHILRMLTLGRSCRVRVVLLDTETNVKAWGIEGRGEARQNLLFIECEEDTHHATMYRWGKAPQWLDTARVLELSGRANLRSRAWAGLAAGDDATLRRLVESAVFETDTPVSKAVSADESGETRFEISFETAEIAKIVAMIVRNESQTRVVKAMPGYRADRHAAFVAKYAEIKAALEESGA